MDGHLRDGARTERPLSESSSRRRPLSPGLPVVALSASSSRQIMPPFAERFIDPDAIRAETEEAHRAFAKRPRGSWKKIPDSTHLIADSQPDAVADVVFDMLDQLVDAGGAALHGCAS